MKINLPSAITSRFGRQLLLAQKSSPKLLFGTGMVLMGATVVSSSRATLRLDGVLYELREDRKTLTGGLDRGKLTEAEYRKHNLAVTSKGIYKITKLYLPSIALGVAAVACLTTSHNQLTRRNAGLSAALVATERAMESYRERVREAYGEDRERELWRGEREESVPVLDDEGRETKSKKKVKIGGGHSPYARVWGADTSSEWTPLSPEYNVAKLRSVQEWGTLRIRAYGHVFLNEIFDELGLDRTPAGSQVGWLSEKHGGKDGFVDFGVLQPGNEVRFMDFITGDEDHILLDFNVDGEIWRKI